MSAQIMRDYNFPDGHKIILGKRTLIMGILNLTPDSFYDGGTWATVDKALRRMDEMAAEGADIVDIGAESTRPGAKTITPNEEWKRLEKLLIRLHNRAPLPVSLDSYNPITAKQAAEMKAVHLLNDVKGLQQEDSPGAMAKVVAEYKLPVVVMYNEREQSQPGDVMGSMANFFRRSIAIAKHNNVPMENIILDPGIGFNKTPREDVHILHNLADISTVDGTSYPVLVGASRKKFIKEILGVDVRERLEGTLAASLWSVMAGAQILRVHDVKEHVRICRMWEAIKDG